MIALALPGFAFTIKTFSLLPGKNPRNNPFKTLSLMERGVYAASTPASQRTLMPAEARAPRTATVRLKMLQPTA